MGGLPAYVMAASLIIVGLVIAGIVLYRTVEMLQHLG